MSKSKGNVVSPDEMIARYGADATRMYALFAAPPDRDLDWQEDGVAGVSRFLGRVYRLVMRYREQVRARFQARPQPGCAGLASRPDAAAQAAPDDTQDHPGFRRTLALQHLHRGHHGAGERDHRRRARVGGDAGRRSSSDLLAAILPSLILLLAPFAPYLAAELWTEIGGTGSLLRHPWPGFDPDLAREEEMEVPVQVNGKLRAVVRSAAGRRKRGHAAGGAGGG